MRTDLDGLFVAWSRQAGEIPLADASRVRSWGRRRRRVRRGLAAFASLVVVAAVTAVTWTLARAEHRPAPIPAAPAPSSSPVRFTPLKHLGSVPVDFGAADSPAGGGYASSAVTGDRAFVGWHQPDGALKVTAVDLTTRTQAWPPLLLGSYGDWNGMLALPHALIVIGEHDDGTNPDYTLFAVDPASGRLMWQHPYDINDEELVSYESALVVASRRTRTTTALDWSTGAARWTVSDVDPVDAFAMYSAADLAGGDTVPVSSGSLLLQVTADGSLTAYDVDTGQRLGSLPGVGSGRTDSGTDQFFAYEGRLYAVRDEHPYRLREYDLDLLGDPRVVYTAPDSSRRVSAVTGCGTTICLLDGPDTGHGADRPEESRIRAVDPATGKARWQAPASGADALVTIGDRVVTTASRGQDGSQLFDPSGRQLLDPADRTGSVRRVNAASVLVFSRTGGADGTSAGLRVVGVNARDGSRTALGEVGSSSALQCSWNQRLLVCPGPGRVDIWQYANG